MCLIKVHYRTSSRFINNRLTTHIMAQTVLLTGASGFIAQHIAKLLVTEGYSVVGTVRLKNKGNQLVENLKKLGSGSFTYEIVSDIAEENAFDEAFSKHPEISVVLHTASPFFYDTKDPEKELILPAIRGTDNVFGVIKKQVDAGTCKIERVVLTSSDAALYLAEDEQRKELHFDETSWNQITYEDAVKDPITAYYGAKTFAERKAWEFSKQDGFPPLTAVNPVYVFGPQAFDTEAKGKLNTSNEMIRGLLLLDDGDTFSNETGGYIDVRDVARAHMLAFQEDQLMGKRLFMTNGNFSVQMMLDVIHKHFLQFSEVPKGNPGSGELDTTSLAKKDNKETRELVGFEFVPFEKMVVDVVGQIVRAAGEER